MWTYRDKAGDILKKLVCVRVDRQTGCFVCLAEIARAHGALMSVCCTTTHLETGAVRCDCYGNGLIFRMCREFLMRSPPAFTPPPSTPLFLLLQDLFVLLDLIGGPSPQFGNQFPSTVHWLSRLQNIGE